MPSDDIHHKLFEPVKVGNITLSHRLIYPPCSRFRGTRSHEATDLMVEYYRQRASVPGTLLIAEATLIDARAGGVHFAPGVWTDKQIEAWKKVGCAV